MYWMFDSQYLILVALPGLLLAGLASLITKSTFSKYSRVASARGLTGAEAAAELLDRAGVGGVAIERVSGFLSDHYDPMARTLRLSPSVYGSQSLSAIGVACHEAGHAIQHAVKFAPLHLRTAMVPAASLTSNLSYIVIMLGFFMSQKLILVGALLFSVAVLFSVVTLPVEWDASNRAKKLMVTSGVVTEREAAAAGSVLNAAFMTYVASAVTSVLTLLYYLMRAGVFSRDD